MWVIVLFLAAGLAVGYFDLLPQKYSKHIDGMMMNALLLLLFVMGMQMGASEEIWTNMVNIGFNAFMLALLSVGGSVFMVYCMARIFLVNESKRGQEE